MNFQKSTLALLLIAFFSLTTQAQNETPSTEKQLSLDGGSINDQFEFIITKSSNWNDERRQSYEVIKRNWVLKLRGNVLDSLKAVHKNLNDTKATVNKQAQEIEKLKTDLSATQGTLDQTNTEKDSMSLFGIQMSKGGYNTLMWSIIGGLFALLLLFIYKFKDSNSITKQAKTTLAETEEQFEEHRRVALEREQKVRRQLQDEINKQKSGNK
ncbi:tRNA (guanine-N1)-methyltransferase [Pontimicrobium sp. MEBiC01747]|jgi:septal ring factor EnvC (AmiA/AmiB activator)